MGENAIRLLDGQTVKIGTCEQMYYLRADQVGQVRQAPHSLNPHNRKVAESIRFRFPFPDEDGNAPGDFDDFDRGLGLHDCKASEDFDHGTVHFSSRNGIMLSTPCPQSKEGKASGLQFGYNGYAGPVHIHSQKLVGDKLVLVCRCGDCGGMWRNPTLEDAQPYLDSLARRVASEDRQHKLDCARSPGETLLNHGDFFREISRRIVAGYTEPNYWTRKAELVTV